MNAAVEQIPPLDLVTRLQAELQRAGVESVVGGSGLLFSLGLVDEVRDWDLVTDSAPESVRAVLAAMELRVTEIGPGEHFQTAQLLRVHAVDHEIDVLSQFAVRDERGVHAIPARAGQQWRGLRMARPEDWEVAYRAMGRHDRAALLRRLG